MLPLIMVLTWGFLPALDEIRKLFSEHSRQSLAEVANVEYKDVI